MKTAIKQITLNGKKMPARIALLALAIAGVQVANAAEPGFYVGGSVGESQAKIDNNAIVARQLSDGFTNIRLETKDSPTGYKIFGGYQFSPYFAIEGGYFELGDFSYRAFMSPNTIYKAHTKPRGINVDLVGILPLSERFSALGRVGATHYRNKDSYRGYGAINASPYGSNESDNSHKYGLGLQYDLNSNLSLRLEAERYDIDNVMFRKSAVDMYSVGVVYRFGQAAPVAAPVRTPASTAPAQPAVAAAPAPAPAPTPTPTPQPVRVTVSADSLFSFDSSTVSPAGRAELDKLAVDLRGVEYDTIIVIGHTDRMGSAAYNQALSVRRANAVRDYLISSARIPSAKITTRGVGSAQPVTTAAQCGTQLSRAQMIACLAPDRRVEVEVTGTRPR